ncbi:MAG: DUF3318 domain-containing protein [Leptolyngbyaceae bacterium]|nr:DUF3318 domain-containing protein [Leptolyngbyaceae bacterium]
MTIIEGELGRLQELMPASGRMLCRLVHRPEQAVVIDTPLPLPWQRGSRNIFLNLDLWCQMPLAQRDLLLLRVVSWNLAVRWFKVDRSRGMAAVGLVGTAVELGQGDAVGVVVAGVLTVLVATQIWRSHHNTAMELEADETAIQIAQRRGYPQPAAARHLLEAIESVARLERRSGLDFTELLRCQNLKAIAGLSPVGVPESVRQD